jgi:uncharacterized protein (DUF2267 family)
MSFSDLITMLLRHGPFAEAEDAELALTTTLETLGYLLPARLVRELEASLPEPCGWPLSFGRSVSEEHERAALGTRQRELAALPGDTLERIQEVCAVLRRALPSALVEDIVRALPPKLGGAFHARAVTTQPQASRGLQRTLAAGHPGAMHPISAVVVGHTRD